MTSKISRPFRFGTLYIEIYNNARFHLSFLFEVIIFIVQTSLNMLKHVFLQVCLLAIRLFAIFNNAFEFLLAVHLKR